MLHAKLLKTFILSAALLSAGLQHAHADEQFFPLQSYRVVEVVVAGAWLMKKLL